MQNVWLRTCLKSPVSEHLWPVNMLGGPKHSPNLHSANLVIFLGHSEITSARKVLF